MSVRVPQSDTGAGVATGITFAAFLATLLVVVAGTFLGVFFVKEVWRILTAHGRGESGTAQVVRGAVVVFLFTIIVAVAAMTMGGQPLAGASLLAWSVFGFVLVLELADWYGRRHEQPIKVPQVDDLDLDAYLVPFETTPLPLPHYAPGLNGKSNGAVPSIAGGG